MFSDKITYTDFNGIEQTMDVFFHLSKTEGTQLVAKNNGEFYKRLMSIYTNIENDMADGNDVMQVMLELIDMSYGIKSEDGQRFIKDPLYLDNFKSSPAYDVFIFDKLAAEPDYANKFIIGVLPDTGYSTEQLSELGKSDNPQELLDKWKARETERKETNMQVLSQA